MEAEWNRRVSLSLLLLTTDGISLCLGAVINVLAERAGLLGHAKRSHDTGAKERGLSIAWLLVVENLAVVEDLWKLVLLASPGTLNDILAGGRELVVAAMGVLLIDRAVVMLWVHAKDVDDHVAEWQELLAGVARVVGVSRGLNLNISEGHVATVDGM